MNIVFEVTLTAAVFLLIYVLFVKMAKPIYNLDEWSGRLWQWAENNGVSRRKLPRYEENLIELSELDISYRGLEYIPAELCNVTSLTKLIASGNKLSSLPKEISGLTNLTELDFTENLFTDIPLGLFELKKLQKLSFWDNKLTTIPKEIGNLTNLKELDLSNNRLSLLPNEITKLKLAAFSIYGNPNLVLTKEQEEWTKSIEEFDKN
ncbi:MAG: leucine-rich repeat domain-containing protein [Campylobacteraceae bacterium]|jgi:Leucine-rich repeat (LRR) protein|nr:leucine-rich repeat domain-containing protein [Campylobacteraceae bacterium]